MPTTKLSYLKHPLALLDFQHLRHLVPPRPLVKTTCHRLFASMHQADRLPSLLQRIEATIYVLVQQLEPPLRSTERMHSVPKPN